MQCAVPGEGAWASWVDRFSRREMVGLDGVPLALPDRGSAAAKVQGYPRRHPLPLLRHGRVPRWITRVRCGVWK
jgi:hypothetical protein